MVIIDWYSRCMLAWRLYLSNTIESSFCLEALREALTQFPSRSLFEGHSNPRILESSNPCSSLRCIRASILFLLFNWTPFGWPGQASEDLTLKGAIAHSVDRPTFDQCLGNRSV